MSCACMCSLDNEVKTQQTGIFVEVVESEGVKCVLCNDEEI